MFRCCWDRGVLLLIGVPEGVFSMAWEGLASPWEVLTFLCQDICEEANTTPYCSHSFRRLTSLLVSLPIVVSCSLGEPTPILS